MSGIRLGFAMTGSHCTFDKALDALEALLKEYDDVTPIMSPAAAFTDTRFGTADNFIKRLEDMTGRKVITTITDAEPIGGQGLFDLLIIAPCTGNTIAKLCHGVTDTSVTMAAKAHLRNEKPVLIALSTNDGLSGSAANIGTLLNRKNIFFVPFYQDDPVNKPRSLASRLDILNEVVKEASKGRQLQPIISVQS